MENTGGFKPKIGGLQALLKEEERKKQEALVAQKQANSLNQEPAFEYAPPAQSTERIRIIFYDSGSMGGQKILDAHEGCIEFMRNCVVNQTAVAIHPMNYGRKNPWSEDNSGIKQTDLTQLTTNLPALSVLIKDVRATGGTPLFETLEEAIKSEPKATRFIIFSDGEPNHQMGKDKLIEKLNQSETKCDTILIGDIGITEHHPTYKLMKEIADRTGGIFLLFDRSKVNFSKAFKYLAPTLRLQLAASTEMQKALQEGKLK